MPAEYTTLPIHYIFGCFSLPDIRSTCNFRPGLFTMVWMLRTLFNPYIIKYQVWGIVLISVWIFWAVDEIIIEFTRYPFYMDIVFFLLGIMASFYNLTCTPKIHIHQEESFGQ